MLGLTKEEFQNLITEGRPHNSEGRPHNSSKFNNVYRYRIGQHRIIYCVGGKCIKLLTVGKRNDIYERFDADPDIDVGADIDFSGAQPVPIQTVPVRGERSVDQVLIHAGLRQTKAFCLA